MDGKENLTNDEPLFDNQTNDENPPAATYEHVEKAEDARDTIIAQLREQNAALMEQNRNLNEQVVSMVRNGKASFEIPAENKPVFGSMLYDIDNPREFVNPLADLGREAAKPR